MTEDEVQSSQANIRYIYIPGWMLSSTPRYRHIGNWHTVAVVVKSLVHIVARVDYSLKIQLEFLFWKMVTVFEQKNICEYFHFSRFVTER